MRLNRSLLIVGAISLLSMARAMATDQSLAGIFNAHPVRDSRLPQVMFWCWEKQTDMRGLSDRAGVAVLACTIKINGEKVRAVPRLEPLEIDSESALLPVVRIECCATSPQFLERHVQDIAQMVVRNAAHMRPGLMQIDYDARNNERPFYRSLMQAIRKQVPAETFISMTALASWCVGDSWLSDMDVNECVPMFFSMGNGGEAVLHRVEDDGRLVESGKNIALGICQGEWSVGQRLGRLGIARNRRVYLFCPKQWSPENENTCMKEVRQWQ